jgi:hypothetical protein
VTLTVTQLEDDPISKAIACCNALNDSEMLRAKISVRSATGLRFRDLAATGAPCSLIAYWGIWTTERWSTAETELLRLLDRISEIISENLGIEVNHEIILTDTHAQINGVPNPVIDSYLEELRACVSGRTHLYRLSEIVPATAPMPSLRTAMSYSGMNRIFLQLVRQANKLFDQNEAESLAAAYLLANLREAPHVFGKFPKGIFVHLGQTEIKAILPSLPMLMAYTGPGRETRKPWFRVRMSG